MYQSGHHLSIFHLEGESSQTLLNKAGLTAKCTGLRAKWFPNCPGHTAQGRSTQLLNILVGSIFTQLGADLFSNYILSNLCALEDPFLQCPKIFSGDTNLLT